MQLSLCLEGANGHIRAWSLSPALGWHCPRQLRLLSPRRDLWPPLASSTTAGHRVRGFVATDQAGGQGQEVDKGAKPWPFKTRQAAQLSPGSTAKHPSTLPCPARIWLSWGLSETVPTQRPAHQPLLSSSWAQSPVSSDWTGPSTCFWGCCCCANVYFTQARLGLVRDAGERLAVTAATYQLPQAALLPSRDPVPTPHPNPLAFRTLPSSLCAFEEGAIINPVLQMRTLRNSAATVQNESAGSGDLRKPRTQRGGPPTAPGLVQGSREGSPGDL